DRPVLLIFTGADSVAFQASRQMHLALSDVPSTWSRELRQLVGDERDARAQLARAREVIGRPQAIDITRDRSLVDRLGKTVELETMFVQERLFKLRMMAAASAPATTFPSSPPPPVLRPVVSA